MAECGAVKNSEKHMEDLGLAGKRHTVVCGSSICKLTEGRHVKANQEAVLPAHGLCS